MLWSRLATPLAFGVPNVEVYLMITRRWETVNRGECTIMGTALWRSTHNSHCA